MACRRGVLKRMSGTLLMVAEEEEALSPMTAEEEEEEVQALKGGVMGAVEVGVLVLPASDERVLKNPHPDLTEAVEELRILKSMIFLMKSQDNHEQWLQFGLEVSQEFQRLLDAPLVEGG